MSNIGRMSSQIKTYQPIANACQKMGLAVPQRNKQKVTLVAGDDGVSADVYGIPVNLNHGGERIVFDLDNGEVRYAWTDSYGDRRQVFDRFYDQVLAEDLKLSSLSEVYGYCTETVTEDGVILLDFADNEPQLLTLEN